jgi:hypothetical protein
MAKCITRIYYLLDRYISIIFILSFMSCVMTHDVVKDISFTSYTRRQDASIKGFVSDSSQSTLPPCKIMLTAVNDPSIQYTTTIDYEGYFSFASIRGGTYLISLPSCMVGVPKSTKIEVLQGQTRIVWIQTHYDWKETRQRRET